MSFDKWSPSEKKIARAAFDAAQQREFAALISRTKEMSAQLATSADTWDMHHFLSRQLRDIERKYDFRYSQLILVFGRLLREKWLDESDLEGLSADKIDAIRHIATF